MSEKRIFDEEKIVERYLAGESAPVIAVDFQTGSTSIYKVLKRHGINPTLLGRVAGGPPKLTKQQDAEIMASYQAGQSLNGLARQYSVCDASIINSLRRTNTPRRKPGVDSKWQKHLEAIAAMWRSGKSHSEIGRALGISQTLVGFALNKAGIPLDERRASGARHGNWKNGTIRMNGYEYVRLHPGDPFYDMTTISGYVSKHRRAMAQSLGRSLTRSESVHHINGDKNDNRLENLQLRHGQHGNGAHFRCMDCGSTNVVAVKLT